MADALKPRLVSGEIMASVSAVRTGAPADADIIDAEFETLVDEVAFGARPASANLRSARLAGGMATLGRNAGPRRGERRGGLLFWASGLTLAACAFWLSGGHSLLLGEHRQPFGPNSSLRLVDVTSAVVGSGGRPVLTIDGAAVNDGSMPARLPAIEIKVTGRAGRVTRYNLGTSERPLGAGKRFVFSSRLEVPNDGVKTVAVSFREVSIDAGGEGQGY